MQPTSDSVEHAAAAVRAVQQVANRKLARRITIDLMVFTLLVIPIILCEFVIEPFHRGFFCNDTTISYPFRDNTITPTMLGVLIGLVPAIFLLVVEYACFRRRGELSETTCVFGWQLPNWIVELIRQNVYFAFGLTVTFDATEVGKYTIGRLRPHFMAVCQPQLTDGTTCSDTRNQNRYIENYICLGQGYKLEDVRQARLSFPSGHSSLIFYAMVYLVLYIYRRLRWQKSHLVLYLLQFALLLLAWFTALSRIIDNWHHWSDVLAGSLIGVLGALLTVRFVCQNFKLSPSEESLKLCLPRQDTSTTLDEIIVTPPPYTLNTSNSFSNEQYCTKV